jgi:hypothetical protein
MEKGGKEKHYGTQKTKRERERLRGRRNEH